MDIILLVLLILLICAVCGVPNINFNIVVVLLFAFIVLFVLGPPQMQGMRVMRWMAAVPW